MKYSAKVIVAGHVVELYEYENEVRTGKDSDMDKPVGRKGKRKEGLEWIDEDAKATRDKNRADALQRARKNLRRLINANVDAWDEKPKFFTLTFRDNVQDIKWANSEFKKFRQRLSRYIFGRDKANELRYVAVIEFQKRGAIHYHMVTFNMPFIPHNVLQEIWSHGFVHIRAIDDCDNVGAYVTKYMTKDNEDDRLRGEKCYFSSRGLVKPKEEIIEKKDLDALRVALSPNKTYEKTFENEYLGSICYQQYNLKRKM
ncbi:rolling circle replication-associated protein [Parageobacillus thermoglucosidasius]|uniref:rolling circle replication-associated protein n=1 Tax=Parageobacillus thermoglucosidasius TaxID=1426 RepID=UPI0030C662C2